jgi:hypothetical protein
MNDVNIHGRRCYKHDAHSLLFRFILVIEQEMGCAGCVNVRHFMLYDCITEASAVAAALLPFQLPLPYYVGMNRYAPPPSMCRLHFITAQVSIDTTIAATTLLLRDHFNYKQRRHAIMPQRKLMDCGPMGGWAEGMGRR